MASGADNRELILNGSIVKVLFVLGWPMMVTSLLQSAYNLADTFWVGQLGAVEGANSIAALQITWPVVWLMISLGMGFGIAGLALVSQYVGAKRFGDVNKAAGQVFFLFLAFSLVVAVLGFVLAPLITGFIIRDEEVSVKAELYMRMIFISQPFMFISIAFDFLMRGWGDTRTPMYISLVTVILNICLDPIFIFGSDIPFIGRVPLLSSLLGSFDGMGFVGVAYASFISRSLAAIISVYLLFSGKVGIKLDLPDLRPVLSDIWNIIKVGIPASLGSSGAAFGFVIMMFMIARLPEGGAIPLAAYGVGDRIISILFIGISGLQMSLSTIVGQNLGAGRVDRADKAAKMAMLIMAGILATGAILLWLLRRQVMGVFTSNEAVIEEGIRFIGIFGLFMPFFGLFQAVGGVYSGSGHTGYTMALMLVRLWLLRVPLTFLLAFGLAWDAPGVWWAMGISNFGAAMVALAFFLWGKWKVPIIRQKADAAAV